jgi:hypothetical protein
MTGFFLPLIFQSDKPDCYFWLFLYFLVTNKKNSRVFLACEATCSSVDLRLLSEISGILFNAKIWIFSASACR